MHGISENTQFEPPESTKAATEAITKAVTKAAAKALKLKSDNDEANKSTRKRSADPSTSTRSKRSKLENQVDEGNNSEVDGEDIEDEEDISQSIEAPPMQTLANLKDESIMKQWYDLSKDVSFSLYARVATIIQYKLNSPDPPPLEILTGLRNTAQDLYLIGIELHSDWLQEYLGLEKGEVVDDRDYDTRMRYDDVSKRLEEWEAKLHEFIARAKATGGR